MTIQDLLTKPAGVRRETPVGALGRGVVAGLAGTALLSVLSRAMNPPWPPWQRSGDGGGGGKLAPPDDPFDKQKVIEWQNRYDSPAAYQQKAGGGQGGTGSERNQGNETGSGRQGGHAGAMSPATVLAQAQSPGPEGLATEFAFKLAAGMFGRDISRYAKPAGEAVHFTYGSAWGALYGLLQGSYRLLPAPFGLLFGAVVWLVGPALLVPAMGLTLPPHREQPMRLAQMVAGHLIYGAAVAATFEILEREAR